MGDCANEMLAFHMRHQGRIDPRPPRRRKLVACPDCGGMFRGQGGVMDHQRRKHGRNFTWAEIDRAPVEYEGASNAD